MKKNVKLLTDDAVKIQYVAYSTGQFMEYHTLKPLYQNLFDEVVRNEDCEITDEQFDSELVASKLFSKTKHVINKWRAWKTDKKFGIKVNEPMHIEHILCAKFYCNYSKLCEQFRRSYRGSVDSTDDDIMQQHCNNHYWFGRFLTTAIEFWGERPSKFDKFYHGLAAQFKFNQFSAVYEIPTSTTWDISVAQSFADANGVILQLSPKYKDEVNNSRCLNVSELSEFKNEKEKLFAGMTVLSIVNIYNPSDNAWLGYEDWMNAMLYFERIIEQTHENLNVYNHGSISTEHQRDYLVPLLKHQMQRNGYVASKVNGNDDEKTETEAIPKYIQILFQYFCDEKKDHIDLSCINEEISKTKMHKTLQHLLFHQMEFSHDGTLKKYKIDNKKLKRIFPNLVEYRNHMGNWICVSQHQ